MRNAQKAALMAIFAALEEQGDEDEREIRIAEAREENSARLIKVDLEALARGRAKTAA